MGLELNPVNKILGEKLAFLNYLTDIDSKGEKKYFFIAMRGDEMLRFRADVKKKGKVRLSDYGVIIKHGKGEPTKEVIEYMETTYKYKHGKGKTWNLKENTVSDN